MIFAENGVPAALRHPLIKNLRVGEQDGRCRGVIGMIINRAEWEKFEKERIRADKVDLSKNFAILDALYKEAVTLGVFPPKDPLEGLDVVLKIARVVNHVPAAPHKNRKRIL
jgi:hypothetical protein